MAKFTRESAAALHQKAHAAGVEAAEAVTPVPMVVGSPTHPLGSNIDPEAGPVYRVPSGICGVGTIKMPANTSFAREMMAQGFARKSSAAAGCRIYIGHGGQSYEKKFAYAGGYVSVLREAGIDKVYADVRVD